MILTAQNITMDKWGFSHVNSPFPWLKWGIYPKKRIDFKVSIRKHPLFVGKA